MVSINLFQICVLNNVKDQVVALFDINTAILKKLILVVFFINSDFGLNYQEELCSDKNDSRMQFMTSFEVILTMIELLVSQTNTIDPSDQKCSNFRRYITVANRFRWRYNIYMQCTTSYMHYICTLYRYVISVWTRF